MIENGVLLLLFYRETGCLVNLHSNAKFC